MLPIYDIQAELLDALSSQRRLLVRAPTGSGKSTQVPQMVAEHPDFWEGAVVVLQPRRIAARMLAARVARERGGRLGDEVGYQVRLEKRAGSRTRILYATEGVLLRRLLRDPDLRGVAAVVFDEFHERNLNTDMALAFLVDLQRERRPDLLLVAMSATLECGPLQDYLAPCALVESEGRSFPVEIEHIGGKPGARSSRTRVREVPVWDRAARAFERAVAAEPEGDVLIFMPGAHEIRRTIEAVRRCKASRDFDVLALHGEMSAEDQDRAVSPSRRRKVVVSTNVAETSLTIDGVRVVIDSGLARVARFDAGRGMDTLTIQPISQASADQRAGRAGRTAPGRCLRLWSVRAHRARPAFDLPEVRRVDLAEPLLMLAGLGHRAEEFPWYEKPDPAVLGHAARLLRLLGAVDGAGAVTPDGRRMLAFPLHPRFARLLLAGAELGCVREAALAAAIGQARNFWLRRQSGRVEAERARFIPEGVRCDFTVLAAAWLHAEAVRFDREACEALGLHGQAAREVGRWFRQFLGIAEREGLPVDAPPADETTVRRCLLRAFSDQLAQRRDTGTTRCALSGGRVGKLAEECFVRDAPLLVATEVTEIEGRDKQVLLSRVAAVELDWLREDFPGHLRTEEHVGFDPRSRRIVSEIRTCFGDLVLARKPGEAPSDEAAAAFLAREIHAGNLGIKHWNQKVDDWIARVNTLAEHAPELGYAAITTDDRLLILEQICLGATSHREVKDRSPWKELRAWLLPGLGEQLDRFAPERLKLPCGRHARIRYEDGAPPVLAARIQDLYDLTGEITIADGRIPCRIEILAPNQRPMQIVSSLDTFWEQGYPLLKKELKGRYPKHEWR